jgi:ferredoxin
VREASDPKPFVMAPPLFHRRPGSTPENGEVTMRCVTVDYDKCSGLGVCESLAPDFFEVNDEGSLMLLKEDVDGDDLQTVQEAIEGCPTEALSIVER